MSGRPAESGDYDEREDSGFDSDHPDDQAWVIDRDDPGRPVSPSTVALNAMAARVERIRNEIAGWRADDSEHSAAWDLAADRIEEILDSD